MSSPRASKLQFYPSLEGLRGVSVGVVLLFHGGVSWMQGGFLGVSTFFTLSGFLITGLLLDEHRRTGVIKLTAFWGRRFRRLMPAALFTIATIAVFSPALADAVQTGRIPGDGLAALFYVGNWWFIRTDAGYAGLLGSPSPFQHFWSLAIEEQYYLLYPAITVVLLASMRGSRRRVALALAISAVACWVWMAHLAGTEVSTDRIYFGTDTRCGELLAGGLLAVWLSGRTDAMGRTLSGLLSAVGLVGLAGMLWFWSTASIDSDLLYLGGLQVYTAASVAIIAGSIVPASLLGKILSVRGLRWLGRISYGIYLYHWPIYLWVTEARTGLSGLPLSIARLALTLAVSELSYRWLEEPIRRRRRLLAWRQWVVPPLTIAGVAALLVGLSSPVTDLRADTSTSLTADGSRHAPSILVVGDSVADRIAHGLAQWASETGAATVINATRKGCGIARGARPDGASRNSRLCDDWQVGFERPLTRYNPDVVVVYTSGWDLVERKRSDWDSPKAIGDPAFDEWLRSEFSQVLNLLTRGGAHVAWLTPLCVENQKGPQVGVFDPERIRELDEQIITPVIASAPGRATRVDLFSAVCPGGRFTNEMEGITDFRPDGIHFSEPAARWVGYWLGPKLVEAGPKGPNARLEANAAPSETVDGSEVVREPASVTWFNRDEVWNGFTLLAPVGSQTLYWVDMDGRVAKRLTVPWDVGYTEQLADGTLMILSEGRLRLADGSGRLIREIVPAEGLVHHDAVISPDGEAFLIVHQLDPDLDLWYDRVIEVDPSGAVVWQWNSLDHLDPTDRPHFSTPHEYAGSPDWLHMNSIDLFPDGDLLLSLRNRNEIVRVDYPSGDIIWSWGPGVLGHQHSVKLLPNGHITIFDNGFHRTPDAHCRLGHCFSRAVEVDPSEGKVVWQYADREFWSPGFGDVDRLPNGNTLITFGQDHPRATIIEVDSSGEVLWRLESRVATRVFGATQPFLYRAQRVSELPPAGPLHPGR